MQLCTWHGFGTDFYSKLGATCLLLGVDVPEGRIHGPNEMLIVDNFHRGTEMIVHLLELL